MLSVEFDEPGGLLDFRLCRVWFSVDFDEPGGLLDFRLCRFDQKVFNALLLTFVVNHIEVV